MSKIKTFEQACKQLNLDPKKLPGVSRLPVRHAKAIVAHFKLVIITEALNDGWKPNWNNSGETKYYPYFKVNASDKQPSGFGLSFIGYDLWRTYTYVGSRLCFKSWDLAKYAGTQFKKLYEEYFLYK